MTSEGEIPNHVLDSARDFVEKLKAVPEDEELQTLFEQIDQFGPDARSFLQFLSNSFLEKDILDKTMQNPKSVEDIKQRFKSYGVSPDQADMVVEFFNKKVSDNRPPATP